MTMREELEALVERWAGWSGQSDDALQCAYELDVILARYEGYVMVPVEPTEDRVNAYHQYLDDNGIVDRVSASEVYRILIPEVT